MVSCASSVLWFTDHGWCARIFCVWVCVGVKFQKLKWDVKTHFFSQNCVKTFYAKSIKKIINKRLDYSSHVKNSGVTNRRMLFSRPMQSHNKNLYKRRQRHETTLFSFWALRESTSICETTCSVFRVFFLLLVCSSWWRLNKMLAYLKERKVSKSLVFPFVKAIWKTCYKLQLGVLWQYVTSTCVNSLRYFLWF